MHVRNVCESLSNTLQNPVEDAISVATKIDKTMLTQLAPHNIHTMHFRMQRTCVMSLRLPTQFLMQKHWSES